MQWIAVVACAVLVLSGTDAFAERHTLIVLSQDDHTVYDLNPASGHVIRQCRLAGAPREAVFSWDEQYLLVSVPDAGHVAIVELATFSEKGRIESDHFTRPAGSSPGSPRGLATTLDGKLYIGVDGGLLVYDARLLIYNPEWKQAGRKIPVGPRDGRYFRIQGTTDKLYYPHRQDNQVVVIDTRTDAVVKTVRVPGGPIDVVFVPGNEAWVLAEDGSIAVIDTSTDEVKQVIATGGRGAGRIAIAPDIRYVAATHADTGETTILHPLKKEVVATVRTGRGPSVPAFVPAVTGPQGFAAKEPTEQVYVTSAPDSDVALVDLTTMTVSKRQQAGKGLVGSLIRYTFHQGWWPPRASVRRVVETDLFTAYDNAMFLYDVSPVHEHRSDMVGVFVGTGIAKIGCWDPACPPEVVPTGRGGLPYNNTEGLAGNFTGISRGTLHQEEGGSPSPRRMVTFDLKNDYYRQTRPPRASVLANAGLRRIGENGRAFAWDVTLLPGGKPVALPDGDLVVVYLAGGLLRVVREGTPEIVSRFFGEWDWRPRAHTVEALTHPMHMVILELK